MVLLFSLILLLADASGEDGSGSGTGSGSPPPAAAPDMCSSPWQNPLLLLPIILVLAYFILLRPAQKRQERERQALVSNLNKNDKVITNAGIIGVVHATQDDEVVLKLEDNAKMRILKSTIFRNVSAEERQKATAAGAAPKTDEPPKEQKT